MPAPVMSEGGIEDQDDQQMDSSWMPSSESASSRIVHRCRFVEYQPSAINAMAFTPESCLRLRHQHEDVGSKRYQKDDFEGVCYLACVRENGNIELWNAREGWFLEKIIPGVPNSAIESVLWVHGPCDDETSTFQSPRLFTAGLDGLVREWDTVALIPKYAIESNGGSIWCMSANALGTTIAIGCEDGCVRLLKVNPANSMSSGFYSIPGLEYFKTLDKADARILSICWSKCNNFVVVGTSDGVIRKLDIRTGRVIQRISVDATKKKRKNAHKNSSEIQGKCDDATLVWAVIVLADGTIVSGDSLGNVCFWNNQSGTLKQLVKVHAADVLCLTSNKEGSIVYSSGVDRVIVQHRLINKSSESEGKWIPSVQRRYHSHDVRGLALYTHETNSIDALVSGGVDTTLILSEPASKFDHVKQRRMSCWPHRPIVYTVKQPRWVVEEKLKGLRIWQLGKKASKDSSLVLSTNASLMDQCEESRVPLSKKEKLIAELNLNMQSNLSSSAVSPLGSLIAVSDAKQIKVFGIASDSTGALKLKKLKTLGTTGAVSMHFTPCESKLIVCGLDSIIRIIEIIDNSDGFDLIQCHTFSHHCGASEDDMDIDIRDDKLKPILRGTRAITHHQRIERATILSSQLSPNGKWLVSGDSANRIFIFDIVSNKMHSALPLFSSLYTAMTFNPSSTQLALTLSSNELYLFDVEAKKFNQWTQENIALTPRWLLNRKEIISGVAYSKENRLLLWGALGCTIVDLDKPASVAPSLLKEAKRRKKMAKESHHDANPDEETLKNFTRFDRFQPLMLLDFISESEMIVVERPLLKMMEGLPQGFFRERYGT